MDYLSTPDGTCEELALETSTLFTDISTVCLLNLGNGWSCGTRASVLILERSGMGISTLRRTK